MKGQQIIIPILLLVTFGKEIHKVHQLYQLMIDSGVTYIVQEIQHKEERELMD